jgi:HEAT repeat protein
MRRLLPLLLLLLATPALAETFAELRARFEREKGQDFQARYKTVQAIADLATPTALRFLVKVVEEDADSSIRNNTVHQIGRMPLPEAGAALIRFYRENEQLRSSVISSFASYRKEPLPEDIVREIREGSDQSLRSSLIRYLGLRKDPTFLAEAERFLMEFPTSTTTVINPLTQHASPEAGRLLVKIYDDTRQYDRDQIPKMFADGSPEARSVLAEAIELGKEPWLTHAAQIAARAKVAEVEPVLAGAIDGMEDGVHRAVLLECLGHVGLATEAARELVLRLLRSPDEEVAVSAIRAIRAGPVKEAIPVLISMLRAEDGWLRAEIVVTLGRITGQQFGDRIDLWEAWWANYGDEFDPAEVKPPDPDVLDQTMIDLAIEKGAAALRKIQGRDPPWIYASHPTGTTALVILALHAAGTDPKDRAFREALAWLLDQPVPDRTYETALVAMALNAVGGKRYKRRIAECARRLAETQNQQGYWGYPTGNGDHSNSQYAVLGLRAAARAGVKVHSRTWRAIRDHLLGVQGEDGGWSYTPANRTHSSCSMSAAGVSCMLIVLENLEMDEEEAAKVRASIDRGFDALGEKMNLSKDTLYALYGIERAGILGSRALMGGKPWYAPGAKRLVEEQGRDGFWRGNYDVAVQTAFAILFLKKATAPISSR